MVRKEVKKCVNMLWLLNVRTSFAAVVQIFVQKKIEAMKFWLEMVPVDIPNAIEKKLLIESVRFTLGSNFLHFEKNTHR